MCGICCFDSVRRRAIVLRMLREPRPVVRDVARFDRCRLRQRRGGTAGARRRLGRPVLHRDRRDHATAGRYRSARRRSMPCASARRRASGLALMRSPCQLSARRGADAAAAVVFRRRPSRRCGLGLGFCLPSERARPRWQRAPGWLRFGAAPGSSVAHRRLPRPSSRWPCRP